VLSPTPALLIAGLDGIIRSATAAATPLFGWPVRDLLGRNVSVLIPERLRRRHADALRRVEQTCPSPWVDRTIATAGLTREGQEVPILVTLSGWQTGKGEWLISAEIRPRGPEPDSGAVEQAAQPE
jgi:PAS domain S-box-containing protein